MNRIAAHLLLLCAALLYAAGCAKTQYRFLEFEELRPAESAPGPPEIESSVPASEEMIQAVIERQFERGEPYIVLDGLGNVVGLFGKFLFLNGDFENHSISRDTEWELARYLAENNLRDVKVRLNQYAPGDEWSRLADNTAMGAGWRYTLGTLVWLVQSVLPGRIFGGDSYNPYSNTISIYSDIPAVALHEGGHAKDFAQKEYKGLSAAARLLPLVPLFQESEATSDALTYYQHYECRSKERAAYNILYPAYSTYIGGEIARFVGGGPIVAVAAVVPGHIAGRIKSAGIDTSEDQQSCSSPLRFRAE